MDLSVIRGLVSHRAGVIRQPLQFHIRLGCIGKRIGHPGKPEDLVLISSHPACASLILQHRHMPVRRNAQDALSRLRPDSSTDPCRQQKDQYNRCDPRAQDALFFIPQKKTESAGSHQDADPEKQVRKPVNDVLKRALSAYIQIGRMHAHSQHQGKEKQPRQDPPHKLLSRVFSRAGALTMLHVSAHHPRRSHFRLRLVQGDSFSFLCILPGEQLIRADFQYLA